MPAFCYLRHASDAVPAAVIQEMGKALRPSDPEAPGELRQSPAPGGTLLTWLAPHVAQDLHRAPCGGLALLTGEAIGADSPRRLTAAEVFADPAPLQSASGFFAWLRIQSDGSLSAGSDPFGLYPVYYLDAPETLAVATSTAVLRAHPRYNRALDPVGMFRHLIENGCAGERTLEKGGKRLPSGHVLHVHPDTATLRLENQGLSWLCDGPKITDEREAIALSVHMSEQAFLRQTQGRLEHMLLSGGLDSRQLAALARRHGYRPRCHTFGKPTDMEAFLARRTARSIRSPWSCVPDTFPAPLQLARSELDMLSLAGGFNTVTLRGVESVAKRGGTRLLSGLMLDNMYSPMLKAPSAHEVGSFDYCMDLWINRFGVQVDTLRGLARAGDAREALEQALTEIHSEWQAYPGDLTDRLWRTILQHRMRPHLGGYLWKCVFHSWLMLPALDVPFVLATRRISGDILKGRALQRQTLTALSPALARIPLDSISDNPQSILPGRWNALQHRLFRARLRRAGLSPSDAQRFPTIMALTHPAWQEIRRHAESGRPALETFLDASALQAHLPGFAQSEASHAAPLAGPLAGYGGHRLLLGLMLWLDATRGIRT